MEWVEQWSMVIVILKFNRYKTKRSIDKQFIMSRTRSDGFSVSSMTNGCYIVRCLPKKRSKNVCGGFPEWSLFNIIHSCMRRWLWRFNQNSPFSLREWMAIMPILYGFWPNPCMCMCYVRKWETNFCLAAQSWKREISKQRTKPQRQQHTKKWSAGGVNWRTM